MSPGFGEEVHSFRSFGDRGDRSGIVRRKALQLPCAIDEVRQQHSYRGTAKFCRKGWTGLYRENRPKRRGSPVPIIREQHRAQGFSRCGL